ncbi:MAG: hypothetical protein QNK04_21835 [Myxococcota bacterium]|nr:hypothetical protein [Myxococcota bacterium]
MEGLPRRAVVGQMGRGRNAAIELEIEVGRTRALQLPEPGAPNQEGECGEDADEGHDPLHGAT